MANPHKRKWRRPLLLPSRGYHWRLAIYDFYIGVLRRRIQQDWPIWDVDDPQQLTDYRTLLELWIARRREFQQELAREGKRSAHA